ncbi:MAG: glycosyltransferase family 4 protein [Bacteroidales bacterium]
MKILQLITLSELGGAQSVVTNLANILCEEHEVCVASSGDGAMWRMLDKRVKQIKVKHLCRKISPLNDLITLIELRRIYAEFKPDIIHLHSSKAGILGRIAFPKSKIVYTVHGFDSIRVAFRKFLPIEKLLSGRAKSIVAVSQYDYNNLITEGITKNLSTIYNGITPLSFDPSIKLPNNQCKTILTIARVASPKRYDLFEQLARLLPQYNFVWIGNSQKPQSTPPNLYCLGEIQNAARYYALVDLCLLPSNYEGLPMTIIEAMSFGKPIIASDVGGISEIVRNNENGFALENNPTIFAEKIKLILDNKEVLERFGQKSKQIFEQDLTAQLMVKKYLNIYTL